MWIVRFKNVNLLFCVLWFSIWCLHGTALVVYLYYVGNFLLWRFLPSFTITPGVGRSSDSPIFWTPTHFWFAIFPALYVFFFDQELTSLQGPLHPLFVRMRLYHAWKSNRNLRTPEYNTYLWIHTLFLYRCYSNAYVHLCILGNSDIMHVDKGGVFLVVLHVGYTVHFEKYHNGYRTKFP